MARTMSMETWEDQTLSSLSIRIYEASWFRLEGEGVVVYPAEIDMEIGWHAEVCPGGPIRREHDEFMLQRLENGN